MNSVVFFVLVSVAMSSAAPQFFPSIALAPPPLQRNVFQPSFPVEAAPRRPRVQPHPAVVLNSENEAKLPSELLNDFYKNPRIVQALAKDSWFGPDEMQVINREADKIPRQQVFKLLRQAGLARRR